MTATTALQRTTGFLATRLSDNIGETEEHFLCATNCVLGRCGTLDYAASELPREVLDALGINPGATVRAYRSPGELFDPRSLASLNGKSLTLEHPFGGRFVTPDNVSELEVGTVLNPRPGEEPLEDGNLPLLGDIIIKNTSAIDDVKSGRRRALSLGYSFDPVIEDGKLFQTSIRYNHCALVTQGRCGHECRIVDHAMEREEHMTDKEYREALRELRAIANKSTRKPAARALDAPTAERQYCEWLNKIYTARHGKPLQSTSPPRPEARTTSLAGHLDQFDHERRRRAFDSGAPPLTDHQRLELQCLLTGPYYSLPRGRS